MQYLRFALALQLVTTLAVAGINNTTVHSRANCVNNESITWWLGHAYNWRVVSIHLYTPTKVWHPIDTGYATTWRQAAVHWNEGTGGWEVNGYHYLHGWMNDQPFDWTFARDCNIYDGWWDY